MHETKPLGLACEMTVSILLTEDMSDYCNL